MKSKIPCEPGPCAVDEVGPGDRALRRRAGAQAAETTACSELFEVGEQAGLHHAFRQTGVHPVHADDDHLLPQAPRDVAAAAEPVIPDAQPGGADGRDAAEPLSRVLRFTFGWM